ncbi:putative flavoprotein (TIGR03862 family) [Rhodoferax ferrireducens]|uniref:Flavoprotein (TIGR03862 family) n=1 Tax=Rhodoferax ferrireducens TaxID=192843 RepID=A0ABU2C9Y4_9BURK|nr:TIGR03862 family flavoprotein [Rhodoferax ferrireducens]MDR7378131.1 putative flavoprotein (TIGR03862 family) [Rhodoferax ferrireducens]
MQKEVKPTGKTALVIGGGPAGLMAAEVLAQAGVAVQLFDAMPSVGRKFLLAGKGGLNLTHSEPAELFATRFGTRQAQVGPWLQDLGAAQLRDWAKELGVDTFVGSSGRVFPTDMKSAPLLRAWLHRLRVAGVQFHMRHRWVGLEANTWRFDTPKGPVQATADAVVLALGGGSWARLGSDGAWVPLLQAAGVPVVPLLPANCGFDVAGWTEHFSSRFAGQPFKTVALSFTNAAGESFRRQGEFVATASGIEGSLVYAASALVRDEIALNGSATVYLDLLPALSAERVLAEVAHPRGTRSLSSHLKSRLGLEGIKAGILHELLDKASFQNPAALAAAIKSLPIRLVATRPIDEAISSAGGVAFEALNADLMLEPLPGVFAAGEMLDWEAPTGGYLLTASMASGQRAGQGVLRFLGL